MRRALFLVIAGVAGSAVAAEPAWVAQINGAPTVERAGQSTALHRGDVVAVADTVVTDATSKVKILLADDSVLTIGPKSRVILQQFMLETESRTVQLQVLAGRFKVAIAKFFGKSSDYHVTTPTAVAGVRGTVLWGDTDLDAICALDGHIDVRPLKSSGTPARLSAGQCVTQMGAGKTAPLKPSAAELAAYLKEVTLE